MLYRLANSRRTGAAAQPFRVTTLGIACALAVLATAPAAAQSGKLEAAYVVIGGEGAVARAVLTDAVQCPAITIGDASQPMSIRARPENTFPVLVCEAAVASGATSAAIEGQALPLPKPSLHAIAVFGDTGCRLKASKKAAKTKEHD